MGAGWLEQEFEAFGYRFGTIGDRFDALGDTLAILEGLLEGEGPVTHHGSVWSVRDARLLPAPVQRQLPLWVGGKGGPRLLRSAARHATGWNTVWRFTETWYRERVDAARAICEEAGRDPATFRLTTGLYAFVGDDEARARAIFERGRAAMPGGAMDADTYETWCAETLSGTPGQVIERVGGARGAGGRGGHHRAVGPALRGARPGIGGTVRGTGHRPAARHGLMSPREGVLAVLRDAGDGSLHWTVIQDRALRAGFLDPFEVRDVRKAVLGALAELVATGAVRKEAKGVYRIADPS